MSEPSDFIKETKPVKSGPKWSELDGMGKALFIGRVCICLITFGMVYPNAFG